MQDQNNENTHPTRLNHGTEETIPSRVQHEPVFPPLAEVPPSNEMAPSDEVTHPMNVSSAAAVSEDTAYRQAPDLPPPPPPSLPVQADKPHRARRWPWILLGILMI